MITIFWAALILQERPAAAAYEPRVAVVLCEDSYAASWELVQMSSHGLVGLAGLAGVPYDTLLLSELVARPVTAYTSVWISSCMFLSDASMAALAGFLDGFLRSGGTLLLDGPIGLYARDESGNERFRGTGDTEPILGVGEAGWHDIGGYAVHTTDAEHPIARRAGHPAFTPLTQGIAEGIETLALVDRRTPGNAVLLELVAPAGASSHPYLLVTEPPGGGKVAAIASYGSSFAGASTSFRNETPSGFFDNQLLPYLVEAVLWLLGPEDQPFVGLQLSHAPMTVVGRLDADWSNHAEATRATFDYLNDLARDTGVATVYAIVSTFAPATGWDVFRAPGILLEALGGALGSHSATHNNDMSNELDAAGWQREVGGSMQAIRDALTGPDFAPAVNVFINPGDTIHMGDYGRFFADVDMYMTHGFETAVPYACGVMGFGLPPGVPARPVVNNTPGPDFQWLYLPEWGYSVAEAAAFQERILGYYQHTVGRGVLYNQMWHDYSIGGTDPPPNDPDAPTTLPLYDANWAHFLAHPIYAAGVDELIGKMHLAHGVRLSSQVEGARLTARLDFTAVQAHLAHSAAMGLRVHHGDHLEASSITAVTVDGAPHPAFSADTVILPPAQSSVQEVIIDFGPAAAASLPRLTYLSKPLDAVTRAGDALEVALARPGEATRLCLEAPKGSVLLDVDAYARDGETRFCGSLRHGSGTRAVRVEPLAVAPALHLKAAERAIERVTQIAPGVVRFELAAGAQARLTFEAASAPASVLLDGAAIEVPLVDGILAVDLPASDGSVLVIDVGRCRDADGDGLSTCDDDCDDGDPALTDECRKAPDLGGGCACQVEGSASGQGAVWMLLLGVMLLRTWRRRRRAPAPGQNWKVIELLRVRS